MKRRKRSMAEPLATGPRPGADRPAAELDRRTLLRGGLFAAAGCLAAHLVRGGAAAASTTTSDPPAAPRKPPKAKAVIQIWMWGGPTHIDTFDPKPDAGQDYTGPLTGTQATSIPGVHIGELLPRLAKLADKYAIIRSMTHGVNAHETASYVVQTGHPSGGRIVYPSAGAVVSLFKGYDAGYQELIPPYVVLTRLQGRFSEAGFLGPRYKPFATGGDPNRTPFVVEGIVAQGISDQRQRSRRQLLERLNTLGRVAGDLKPVEALARSDAQAYDLILGEGRKVFDLGQEKPEVRDRYGRNTFGQSCLMARRLVEKGVPYITINYPGWDTHKQHFQTMRRRLPELDNGLASLLEDLDQRGLLDSTIVWWSGEFGRTPKVQWQPPWNGGRGHWGRAFSALVAGGGFRGGAVVGATDEKAQEVKDRPVYPWDLLGSMYQLLGIDPAARLPHPEGLPVSVLPGPDEQLERGGLLEEIT